MGVVLNMATRASFLEEVRVLAENIESFTTSTHESDTGSFLVLSHTKLHDHPPHGQVSRVRIKVGTNREFVVHVLFTEQEKGHLTSSTDIIALCGRYSPESMEYKFCPGYDPTKYQKQYYDIINYHVKGVRHSTSPIHRVESSRCLRWHKIGKTSSKTRRQASEVLCRSCVIQRSHLDRQVQRKLSESPSSRAKRQCASSKAKLTFMSPLSQRKRKQNQQKRTHSLKAKLARYESANIDLDDEQGAEMQKLMETIDMENPDKLEEIIKEGEKHGVGEVLREIWNSDKHERKENFAQDQKSNATGSRGNRWSMITIRMALAIYIRSPAAYEALKDFGILQLPCRSTMQAYVGPFLHQPGASSICLNEQVARYVIFKEDARKAGRKVPMSDGILVFDEVKVVTRLMWNSKSQRLIGLAMTSKDQASLHDIYQVLTDSNEALQTSYILQFLWRDMTSSFDIIGPYYTAPGSLESKFVLACVFETIKLFHLHELKTSALVCDGASSNLSVIKASHGHCGVYKVVTDKNDPFEIKPWMINPFSPPNPIFWIICPSHQLKNMINALWSSKPSGTKQFICEETEFGWSTIKDMYERECLRVKNGQTRMVPKLKEAYVIRDSWTKLNVGPAKIMQQEEVLSELFSYIHENRDDKGAAVAMKYLEACHKIFERGFLSHDRIVTIDSNVIQSIDEGYSFFTQWFMERLEKDPQFLKNYSSATQREYLSWQTWDLLRVCVYGFRSFCQYFLTKYPSYYLVPVRISGSAVETIFSQYKHTAGGKLDAANFETVRAANLVKRTTACHHSGKSYRDDNVNIIELPLTRKKYGRSRPTQ